MAPDPEQSTDALTRWFSSMEAGDEQAATQLFEHCFPRMLRYARNRLPDRFRRALDEEDVALSAFKSLYNGAQRGAFADIQNRDALWKLLTRITARKAVAQIRRETRVKRGGGQVHGESIYQRQGRDDGGLHEVPADQVSPELIAQIDDQCRSLMDALGDDILQTIAILRMEGYTVEEVAERVGCAKRSVERRLNLIRKIWEHEASAGSESKSSGS